QRVGAFARVREAEVEPAGRAQGGGEVEPLQCLDPALDLARLARLRTEAVDESLQLGRALRIATVVALGERLALGALALAGRVAARVADQAAVLDRERGAHPRVEEVAVVRHAQADAPVARDATLPP